MAYKALYNKYRPTTFEEVAGQQAIVRTLRNAINGGKIAHAYLFCGPRGTGKTSMARLFAKALNCEQGVGHQCNSCENCQAINSNSHPDVIEIDAASNNGVDQVRDLIDRVRYSPIKGKTKVYIIDEVHMMSAGAFNALLKTLEEPPEHVIFILATTEPHKVLPTILSRCQRYDFGKIEEKEIKNKLVWILGKEGIHYEEAALDEVVELADGGMRDALSILDQVLAYGGNKLVEKDVLAVFGLTSNAEKVNLLSLIRKSDIGATLGKFNEFAEAGVDIKRLSQSLLSILKDALIYARTKDPKLLSSVSENYAKEVVGLFSTKQCNDMIEVLLKTQINFKSVSNIRSLFELTLLQLCALFEEKTPQIEHESPKIAKKEEVVSEPVSEPKPEPKPEPVSKPEPIAEPVVFEAPAASVEEPTEEEKEEPQGIYTGSEVPSWLLEEEAPAAPKEEPKPEPAPEPIPEPKPEPKPAPKPEPKPEPKKPALDVSFIKSSAIMDEGERWELSDDTIINIMVLGGKFKAERQRLAQEWERLQDLKFDLTFSEAATLLAEGRPFCLCEEALLINFNFPRQKERANIRANQATLSGLVQSMLGRKVFVYCLDRNDSNRCQSHYFSLKQVGKLPRPDQINLGLPKGDEK